MKKLVLIFWLFVSGYSAFAQDTLHVLFIGNSYTAVNNLPQVIKDMAAADGHVLQFSSSTPGGGTLQQQSTNPVTLNLIQQGGWDYVVLQGQSQIPSFPENQVEVQFYPYAKRLDSLIHVFNPCTKTVFYVTWGRENGDSVNGQIFPPVATYEGMDSLLTLRYTNIADSVHAYLSPVGPLWHVIRDNYPGIELYQADQSHPSVAGTFAAACSFYSILFGNTNIQNNTYNYMLSDSLATLIRNTAQQVVSDSLHYWYRFDLPVKDSFAVAQQGALAENVPIQFANYSENAVGYLWDFGDGQMDTAANTTHIFQQSGFYHVCLTAYKHCDTVQYCDSVEIYSLGIHESQWASQIEIFPNPAHNILHLENVSGGTRYFISDLIGRKLQSGLVKNEKSISVGRLQEGIYFLYLKNNNGEEAVLKFQKQ